jgi:hypothetical protein
MAERKRRPTREELDERLRFVLGKIPVSVIDGERPEPEVTPVATSAPKPEPAGSNASANGSASSNGCAPTSGNSNGSAHGNGSTVANGNGHGRIVGGRITGAGEG